MEGNLMAEREIRKDLFSWRRKRKKKRKKKRRKKKKSQKRTGQSSGPHQSSKPASEKLRRAIPVRVVRLGSMDQEKRHESPLVVLK